MFTRSQFSWIFIFSVIVNAAVLHAEESQHVDELSTDARLSLRNLVEQSLPHYPNSLLLNAKKQELEARKTYANGFLPSAPSLLLRNQHDQLQSRNGESEWEAGIELPIWLSGQRKARAALAAISEENIHLDANNMRLQLAGMVRDALWDIQLSQGLLEVANTKYQALQQLQLDVEKRVKLGDLAQKDGMQAQTETLQAESEKINAEAEVQHAKFRYINLTGLNIMPADFSEAKSSKLTSDESHPALQEANGKIALNAQRRNITQIESRDNPTVLLGVRSLRGATDVQYNNSLGVTLRIPLQTESRNAPLLAAAEMQYAESQVNLNQLKQLLAAAMHEAEHNLEVGSMQLKVLTQQTEIAQKNLTVTHKAFQLGELDLNDLMRVQTQAFNAERALKNQQIQQLWNIARFNQAVGDLP